ncbi:MAG: single-stranded DNA-binding protein [Bacilli bacterium]|nr:single-stranded DNA-binding protein [Bacilli bacterium]
MNRVMLIGRLTAKPELRYTNSNVPFARFTVAVNRQFNNQDGNREADFINIIAWRKQAEVICNYFDKGNQIAIEGRIQTGSYDDKDGNKRYTTDVVLDQFHFIESRAQRENGASNNNVTPYDYQEPSNDVNIDTDPFADFGDSVSIDDNFLD